MVQNKFRNDTLIMRFDLSIVFIAGFFSKLRCDKVGGQGYDHEKKKHFRVLVQRFFVSFQRLIIAYLKF